MRCQRRRALPLAPLCTPSNAPLFPGRFLPLAGRSDAESRAADPLTQVRRTAGRLPSCTVVALGALPWRYRSASAVLLTPHGGFQRRGALLGEWRLRAALGRLGDTRLCAADRWAVWSRAAGCAVLLWAKGARPVRGERLVR